jgi:H+/Cl- antiporter ClcA
MKTTATIFNSFPYFAKWLLLSSILGICIGSASAGFLISLEWVTDYREAHPWLIAFLPLCGLLVGLLYHYIGKGIEAGNNLLLDTLHEPKQIVPFKMAPLVYIGTIATHLFGGSAGREGTALQIAGAIADQLTHPFKLTPEERKLVLTAAVAGGFGSVFGTPLAGLVFSLEWASIGQTRYQALFPALFTSLIANQVTTLWQAAHTHYHIVAIPSLTFEYGAYAIIAGIVFGLCAKAFSMGMHYFSGLFKTYIKISYLRPFVGGCIVALLVWLMGTTKYIGLGIPTIVAAFDAPLPPQDFALKMALTLLTLSAGFKGGEVTPLFFIGATLGSALSAILPIPTGLLAGMGFVSVFAGATNTPIACTLMAIELFGSECGSYAAIACCVAYFCSGHTSIYQNQRIEVTKNPSLHSQRGKSIGEV